MKLSFILVPTGLFGKAPVGRGEEKEKGLWGSVFSCKNIVEVPAENEENDHVHDEKAKRVPRGGNRELASKEIHNTPFGPKKYIFNKIKIKVKYKIINTARASQSLPP